MEADIKVGSQAVTETVNSVIQEWSQKIQKAIPQSSPYEGRWLFQRACDGKINFWTQVPWSSLPEMTQQRFLQYVERRLGGEPLQYILGSQFFMDAEFAVGPGVFIPRAETEDILREMHTLYPQAVSTRCLDLCAGSGAMGIGLTKLYPVKEIHFVENSIHALPFLIRNAESVIDSGRSMSRIFHCEASAFLRDATGRYDIIVCNPPYVGTKEKKTLPVDVQAEPQQALFAGEAGMDFYPLLMDFYHQLVADHGLLLFEHHSDHQPKLLNWIQQEWRQVQQLHALRDLAGRPRGILVKKHVV